MIPSLASTTNPVPTALGVASVCSRGRASLIETCTACCLILRRASGLPHTLWEACVGALPRAFAASESQSAAAVSDRLEGLPRGCSGADVDDGTSSPRPSMGSSGEERAGEGEEGTDSDEAALAAPPREANEARSEAPPAAAAGARAEACPLPFLLLLLLFFARDACALNSSASRGSREAEAEAEEEEAEEAKEASAVFVPFPSPSTGVAIRTHLRALGTNTNSRKGTASFTEENETPST